MGDFRERSDFEIKQEEFISTNVLNHEINIKHEPDDSENVMENIHDLNTDYKPLETIKTEDVADLYSTLVKVNCGNGYTDELFDLKGQVSFDNAPGERHKLAAQLTIMYKENDESDVYKIQSLPCRFCDYKATREELLAHHLLMKHEIMVWFQCQFCIYRNQLKRKLKHHMYYKHNNNFNNNNMWLHCDFCDYKTRKKTTFRKHVKYKHSDKFKWHHCKLCGYKTKLINYLNKHHKNKHDQNAEQNHPVISDFQRKIINNFKTKIKIRLNKSDCYSGSNEQMSIIPVKLGQNVSHKRENSTGVMVYEGNVKSEEIHLAERYSEDINHVDSR